MQIVHWAPVRDCLILIISKVDVIKTVTIPLMKRFLLDDEGLDLKVKTKHIRHIVWDT